MVDVSKKESVITIYKYSKMDSINKENLICTLINTNVSFNKYGGPSSHLESSFSGIELNRTAGSSIEALSCI